MVAHQSPVSGSKAKRADVRAESFKPRQRFGLHGGMLVVLISVLGTKSHPPVDRTAHDVARSAKTTFGGIGVALIDKVEMSINVYSFSLKLKVYLG